MNVHPDRITVWEVKLLGNCANYTIKNTDKNTS